ncbi:sodium:proton antiporter [Neisseriaceae bacterium CLB008]|nr:sodium:proton antiporter [Neisseriaceae bacterium]
MHKTLALLCLSLLPLSAQAVSLDGTTLSMWWGLPFLGTILSVATFPLFAPKFWHRHFGKVTAFWSLAFLLPLMSAYGAYAGVEVMSHALFSEYLPFILLLVVLYTVSGGILVAGDFVATPKFNLSLLALGTLLASFMGTTGAAMLLIRPLLAANQNRRHKTHVVIFFIFLVANIGGGLTPLGDPPLFLGFLSGVDFFWTMRYMLWPVLMMSSILLLLFYALDTYYFHKEGLETKPTSKLSFVLFGKVNFILLLVVIAAILVSGFWHPNVHYVIFGTSVPIEGLIRDGVFVLVTLVSLMITPKQVRGGNDFTWAPMKEVAKLFLGIFITITPVIVMLKAGSAGAFSAIHDLAHYADGSPNNVMYFWVTTALSAGLDNAPTYLVFFNMASGDAQLLMGPLAQTLLAISMGTVFTGPLTYIGNAPNFMVKTMAEERGYAMPSFFGYFLIALAVLLPLYGLMNWVFLR